MSKVRYITVINSSGRSELICSSDLHRMPAELEANPGLVCSLSCVLALPQGYRLTEITSVMGKAEGMVLRGNQQM